MTGAPLRVAVVARSVYPLHRFGGLERHVFDLVRSLLDREVHVTLITPPAHADRPADAEADANLHHPRLTLVPVPYTTFPLANRRGTTILDRSTAYPVYGLRAGRVALRLVADGRVDVVHGLGASVFGYAIAAARRRTAPLVFNPQGMEEFGATDPSRAPLKRVAYRPLQAVVRRCARVSDRVIATDRALVAAVLEHLPVRPEAVRVVPNAIDLREVDSGVPPASGAVLRKRFGVPPDAVLLLSVARLEANKGLEVLVRALSRLVAEGRLSADWRWLVVGDGPQRSVLERAVEAAGLSRQVTFAGRADPADLRGWYTTATVFVHPTLYEGSSLVTLEAMAHRRAIVASRAGGLPDKVHPGRNGWLVEPGDDRALAAALADAVSNRQRLLAMGAESRAIVEREFSWTAAVERTLEIYADVLASRAGPARPRTATSPAASDTRDRR